MKEYLDMNTSHVRVVTHMCGFLVWLYSLSMLPPMVVALFYKEKSLFVFFITFVIFFFALVAERGIQLRNLAFNYVPVMGLL